ncbi:site-specific DNA-methyltransferase [bacterium]|nr:site-specific DNA-methyltransferase [bacterium]
MASKRSLSLVADPIETEKGFKRFVGELWTAEQRQMHSLHYIVSYRASFKPELPDFCIRRYSKPGAVVLDPFCGRGTTVLQANLLGRVGWATDVNPLAVLMAQAKTQPARLDEVVLRLNDVDFRRPVDLTGYQENFAPFYHPDTYREMLNLKAFLKKNRDRVNRFIELLALSRLHGHSPGFFSVYSFPQISIPPQRQQAINLKRHQEPEYRPIAPRIIRKCAQALRDGFSQDFFHAASANFYAVSDSRNLSSIPTNSVDLIVTSPPFLDKVDYLLDNWLECWFSGVEQKAFRENLVMSRSIAEWKEFITGVLQEMSRVLKPGSFAIIEVGEVEQDGKTIYLDEIVAEAASEVRRDGKRLIVSEILVNQQQFTKLANCFKVENNKKGTNTNRLVVLKCSARTTIARKAKS